MSIYTTIENLTKSNSLPHAVIFEGEDRYNASNFFAKCVICSGQDKPCDECRDCIKAQKKVHPDIIQLYPTGESKTYLVDQIRGIKQDAYVLPNEANHKVFVLNDVDNMSNISQNAFLKILEEPPKNVAFALNCKSKTHLLDTVISRAVVFHTEKENDEQDDNFNLSFEIIRSAVFESELDLLIKINKFPKERKNIIPISTSLQVVLRDLYKQKTGLLQDEKYEEIIENITLNKILKAIDVCEELRTSMVRNKSVKIAAVKFCGNFKAALGR